MESVLLDKTLKGKEAFNLFINNKGDKTSFIFLEKKYGLTYKEIKDLINNYKNRVISPKPTEEELKLYNDIINKKETKKEVTEPTSLEFDKHLIEDLLHLKFVSDLIKYSLDSYYQLEDIIKNINNALNNNLEERNKLKLIKIKETLNEEKNKEYIINNKIVKERESSNTINTDIVIKEISIILEKLLTSGLDKIDIYIDQSSINNQTFLKNLPLLEEGNNYEKTLYKEYNKALKKHDYEIELYYKEIINNIKKGIIEKNIQRKFNQLDYYKLTNLSPKYFLKKGLDLVQNNIITEEDYKQVENFFKNN